MHNQSIESHELTEDKMEIVLEAVKVGMSQYPVTALALLDQLDARDLIKLEIVLDMLRLECKGLIYKKV